MVLNFNMAELYRVQAGFFFLNDPPPTEIYPLSLHDALPISTDTAPSPTEKQLLIAGFVYLVTAGAPAGPNIAGGGALTMLSASVCTHACFAFDARGAVSVEIGRAHV